MAQGKKKCTRARTMASPLGCEPDHRCRCSGREIVYVSVLVTDVILAAIVLFMGYRCVLSGTDGSTSCMRGTRITARVG
jgi:uncharacterized membrane protein YozB (DUF420 family)